MLIVLSAALRFHSKPAADCAVRSRPRLGGKARALVAELKLLEAKDIKKQLHVNEALAKQYEKHLSSFESQAPVPACCLYDSSLFNSSSLNSFDEEDAEWANSHVRIFSGLYGLLRPYDEIQALSLPVGLGTKLTTSKGKFLREYWQDAIQREIEEAMKKLPAPVIVNLAAHEDRVLLQEELLPKFTRVVTVDFKLRGQDDKGEAFGEFIRWAIESRCLSVEDLLEFKGILQEGEEETYRISPMSAQTDTLVFEERGPRGGDGGWRGKMADFSGSRHKFIKEVASGKDRWRRAEINKSLARDEKSKRGKKAGVF